MDPAGSSLDLLDGAWWPRSTDVSVELPELVLGLDGLHGEVVSVLLGADGWQPGPAKVRVGRRSIAVSYFASQPASLLTALCAHGDRINLLVVKPQTGEVDAAAAMLRAATIGSRMTSAYRTAVRVRSGMEDALRAVDRWGGEGGHLGAVVPRRAGA
ncbi:DUF5994 family protein [Hamadaea sp. NPDC051192]|uniref:DUF5994 family protein n=1 Tax=Hamadaea sp. NPDC051192 TaxID=3154940 RepID=UPI003414737E